ncbi:MAG: CRISPR-associated helicase Cas3' [Moorellales bacterium]
MAYFAHREEHRWYRLSAHLAQVAVGAVERLQAWPGEGRLGEAAFLVGLAHDFGKYTSFFQHYLRTGKGGPEKQHAFLSALWAAYLAARANFAPSLRLAVFLVVARHHQELVDPETYLVPPRELAADWQELEPELASRLQLTQSQVEDLRSQIPEVARSLAVASRRAAGRLRRRGLPVPEWAGADWSETLWGFLQEWVGTYGELYRAARAAKREGEDLSLKNYFQVLALFSALIDADKIHSARVAEPALPSLPADPVGAYRRACFTAPCGLMDQLREDLFRTVQERLEQAPRGQRLFALTAPTGTGKTLAGLAAAFRLRARRQSGRVPAGRIIYALPFTSIVDQVYSVAEAVLRAGAGSEGRALVGSLPTSWLLKHHHLADPVYLDAVSAGEERPLDASLLLIESWQSEVVVTTFVQLLHTLIGFENRMLKKFHRLAGSVLILDEVQNLPVEYWPVVAATLREAAESLDLSVVLMTATRPEWFSPGEAWELAGDPEVVQHRFRCLDRVGVEIDPDPMTVSQAVARFLENYRSDRAYLVVLNTIRSSVAFYQALREAWGKLGPPLYYLSTNVVPAERERRLLEIRRRRERGEKLVLVSTQVVEAGVDLDFDEVWRDLGPVDAVVQVAGRCNRHLRRERGTVRLFFLVDETPGRERRLLSSYVYGPIHTHAARKLFEGQTELREPDFYRAVADYFRLVSESKSSLEGEQIRQAMSGLRFTRRRDEEPRAVSDFALIQTLPHYADLFLCLDARAQEVWERYRTEVLGQRDLRRRAEAFLAIKRDFRRYLLSVPRRSLVHRLDANTQPLHVPAYLVEEFYDPATGFKYEGHEGAIVY